MNAQNLTRSELISHLQGKSRAQVVETCLDLHSNATNQSIGTFEVPISTARGMVALACSNTQRRLRKQSPDLFGRKANALEISHGRAALMQQYRGINISVRGGAEKRRNFRKEFPGLFDESK